jgi:hypothetical protein
MTNARHPHLLVPDDEVRLRDVPQGSQRYRGVATFPLAASYASR